MGRRRCSATRRSRSPRTRRRREHSSWRSSGPKAATTTDAEAPDTRPQPEPSERVRLRPSTRVPRRLPARPRTPTLTGSAIRATESSVAALHLVGSRADNGADLTVVIGRPWRATRPFCRPQWPTHHGHYRRFGRQRCATRDTAARARSGDGGRWGGHSLCALASSGPICSKSRRNFTLSTPMPAFVANACRIG